MYHGSSYNWLSVLPLLHVRSGALSGSARAVGTVQTWSVVLQGLWANAYLFYEPWTDVTPLVWNWSHYLCSTAMGMQKYASFIYCMRILPNSVCSHAASHLICNGSHLRWCLNISDLKWTIFHLIYLESENISKYLASFSGPSTIYMACFYP